MFGPDPQLVHGLPNEVVVMVVSLTLMVVGLAWLHRALGMDGLAGVSEWRLHRRGWRAGLRRAAASVVESLRSRTFGWWATRAEFALATGALVLATYGLTRVPTIIGFHGPPAVLTLALCAAGYAGVVAGVAWMRRIYLAPLEVDPDVGWRYRD